LGDANQGTKDKCTRDPWRWRDNFFILTAEEQLDPKWPLQLEKSRASQANSQQAKLKLVSLSQVVGIQITSDIYLPVKSRWQEEACKPSPKIDELS
jgi:hypothetical protein